MSRTSAERAFAANSDASRRESSEVDRSAKRSAESNLENEIPGAASNEARPVSSSPPDAAFDTAVTRCFGTRLPIVAGGLMWLSDAHYVAAAARAGIMGFITAASFPEPEDLRREIRACREACNGAAFGVNVSMLPKLVTGEKVADVFKLIIDEGVQFVETSGRNPEAFLPALADLVAGLEREALVSLARLRGTPDAAVDHSVCGARSGVSS